MADPYPSFSDTAQRLGRSSTASRTRCIVSFHVKGWLGTYPTVHRVTRFNCSTAHTQSHPTPLFYPVTQLHQIARSTEPNHITWETLSDNKLSPLLIQKCNGTTAGLGYLEVSLDCPCKYPPLEGEGGDQCPRTVHPHRGA